MYDLFRYLMFLLMLSAPGQVRCNAPLAQATICSVTFHNPYFVETVTPADAKTYPGGGSWYTLELDYARIFRTLLDAGWQGYCFIEMKGQLAAQIAMPQSVEILRAAWAKATA